MKTPFYSNALETSNQNHPVDILEPDTSDESYKMTGEAYNRIAQWILDGKTLEGIGLRAMCIYRCAGRQILPAGGLFCCLETEESQVLTKKMLSVVLTWIVRGRTSAETGRRALAAFAAIRQEVTGNKTLGGIGVVARCSKQAISKAKKRFLENVKPQSRRNRCLGKKKLTA